MLYVQNRRHNGSAILTNLPCPDSRLDVVELSPTMEIPLSMSARLVIMEKLISTLLLGVQSVMLLP